MQYIYPADNTVLCLKESIANVIQAGSSATWLGRSVLFKNSDDTLHLSKRDMDRNFALETLMKVAFWAVTSLKALYWTGLYRSTNPLITSRITSCILVAPLLIIALAKAWQASCVRSKPYMGTSTLEKLKGKGGSFDLYYTNHRFDRRKLESKFSNHKQYRATRIIENIKSNVSSRRPPAEGPSDPVTKDRALMDRSTIFYSGQNDIVPDKEVFDQLVEDRIIISYEIMGHAAYVVTYGQYE